MILPDLFSLATQPEKLSWEPFRPGVEIHRLYSSGEKGSSAALLKYEPGASVPNHLHTGYEHIIVLSGEQSDRQGTHTAGTLVINEPGSQHDIISKSGCIVLIVWEKPVSIQAKENKAL